jgi:hypothetical protein
MDYEDFLKAYKNKLDGLGMPTTDDTYICYFPQRAGQKKGFPVFTIRSKPDPDFKLTLAFHNLRLEKAQKRALDGRIGVES